MNFKEASEIARMHPGAMIRRNQDDTFYVEGITVVTADAVEASKSPGLDTHPVISDPLVSQLDVTPLLATEPEISIAPSTQQETREKTIERAKKENDAAVAAWVRSSLSSLNLQLTALERKNATDIARIVTLETELQNSKQEIQARDKEISRLGSIIERVPTDVLAAIHEQDAVAKQSAARAEVEDQREHFLDLASRGEIDRDKLEWNLAFPRRLALNDTEISRLTVLIKEFKEPLMSNTCNACGSGSPNLCRCSQ